MNARGPRVLLPVLLLVLSAAAAPTAAAEPYLGFDVADPEGDAVDEQGEPAPAHPYADVVRFQVRRAGDQIEEIVTLAGPIPSGQGYNEDFSIQITNDLAPGDQGGARLFASYQVDNDTRRTTVHETFTAGGDVIGGRFEIDGNVATARFNASELDAFECFFPVTVRVFYSAGVQGDAAHPSAYASDGLRLSPNLCDHPGASTEGFDGGACTARAAPAGFADAVTSGPDAALPDGGDLLTLESRWEGDRAMDVITYAAEVPLDDVEIRVEHRLGRADPENPFARAPTFWVLVTSEGGELRASAYELNGSRERLLFPVFVERDGATITASWCGAAMPAFDCHETSAVSSVEVDGRNVDDRASHGFQKGPCSGDAAPGGSGDGSGTPRGPSGGGTGAGDGAGQDNDTPAMSAIALLALVGALAFATRRRRA